ncbi:hypothetical protein MKEN_00216700 [Mycena kentingensis (nom. inval.)]|nr:hypothetical protein MKEN_00216700 [Mycena kentingensis (nom. inval.)]
MPAENQNEANDSLLVDAITTNMGIADGDAADLRLFYTMVQNGPSPMAEVFKTALIYKLIDIVRGQDTKIDSLRAQVQQLVDGAGTSITSDRSLMAEINAAGKAVVMQEGRIAFDNNSLLRDMKIELRNRTTSTLLLGLLDPNTPASAASERSLRQGLGLGASYGKQYARRQIIAILNVALSKATRTISSKMLGHEDRITVPFMLRVLHVRGFGRDNEDLLAQDDDAPAADANDENQGGQQKKRKKKPSVGNDFFSAFKTDLLNKNKMWGADYKAPGWVGYLADLVAYERKRFPNDTLTLLPPKYMAKAVSSEPATPTPAARNQTGFLAGFGASANAFASTSQASSPAWPTFSGMGSYNA